MSSGVPDELLPLLEGLSDDARAARIQLVDALLASGHSSEDLLRAHAADQLALVPLIDGLREDGTRTLDEVAAQYGIDPDSLVITRRALGLPVDRAGAVYGTALEHHAERLRTAVAAGLSLESLVAFNYVIGAAAASIAGGARDSIVTALEAIDPSGNEHTRAVQGAALAVELTPVLTGVVEYAVEEHLREMARRQVTSTLIGAAGGPVADVTIAFADLVGFTALGDSIEPARLGAVAMHLERATRAALDGGVELVKTLGDAVMLAAPHPGAMIASIMKLRALAAEVDELPELRVGIAYGPALSRAGDWYGSVVNRASRLTTLSRPDGVLIDDSVHQRCSDRDAQWIRLGPTAVRGLYEPVMCWSLLPPHT